MKLKAIFDEARSRLESLFHLKDTGGPWRRKALLHLGKLSYVLSRKIKTDLLLERAASLAFTTIVTSIPLAILLVFLFNSFGYLERSTAGIHRLVDRYVASEYQKEAQELADKVQKSIFEEAGAVKGIAVVFLVIASLSLLRTAERVFSAIWNAKLKRGFLQRLGSFWLLLTAIPLILGVSIYVKTTLERNLGMTTRPPAGTSAGQAESGGKAASGTAAKEKGAGEALEREEGHGIFLWLIQIVIIKWLFPVSISFFAFTLIFAYLPTTQVKLGAAAQGGLVAAIGWNVGTYAFGFYIQHAVLASVYGALGVIPFFLLWVFFSWLVALLGVELTYCIQNYSYLEQEARYHLQREQVPRPVTGLLVLERIYRGFLAELPPASAGNLATEFMVPLSQVEDILRILTDANYIVTDADGRLTPTRSADRVRPLEVLEIFPLGVGYGLPAGVPEPVAGAGQLILELRSNAEERLSHVTLADLLSVPAARRATESTTPPHDA